MQWIRWLTALTRIMRIRAYLLIICCMTVLIPQSCRQSGIADGVITHLSDPGMTSTLSADTLPEDSFQDVVDCQDIQVIYDTILVVRDRISDINNYHFRTYSTTTLGNLGCFAMSGRGPGEMISPYIVHCSSSAGLLVRENSTSSLCAVDVMAVIDKTNHYVSCETLAPLGSLDCMPIADSTLLNFCLDGNDYVFRLVGSDCRQATAVNLFPEIGEDAASHLSSLFTSNTDIGKAAQFMVFLPQLSIVSADGHVSVVAVSKAYTQWRSVLSQPLGPDSVQYYLGVASDVNYIYASYAGLPLKRLQDASLGTEIHIFDWSGKFVHAIKVDADIDCLAMDAINKYLYCRRRSDHSIVRYNLNGIV